MQAIGCTATRTAPPPARLATAGRPVPGARSCLFSSRHGCLRANSRWSLRATSLEPPPLRESLPAVPEPEPYKVRDAARRARGAVNPTRTGACHWQSVFPGLVHFWLSDRVTHPVTHRMAGPWPTRRPSRWPTSATPSPRTASARAQPSRWRTWVWTFPSSRAWLCWPTR